MEYIQKTWILLKDVNAACTPIFSLYSMLYIEYSELYTQGLLCDFFTRLFQDLWRSTWAWKTRVWRFAFSWKRYYILRKIYRVFIKYCGQTKISKYIPDSGLSWCVHWTSCLDHLMAGRKPALQQKWQS